jgi:hypothetical protein
MHGVRKTNKGVLEEEVAIDLNNRGLKTKERGMTISKSFVRTWNARCQIFIRCLRALSIDPVVIRILPINWPFSKNVTLATLDIVYLFFEKYKDLREGICVSAREKKGEFLKSGGSIDKEGGVDKVKTLIS